MNKRKNNEVMEFMEEIENEVKLENGHEVQAEAKIMVI